MFSLKNRAGIFLTFQRVGYSRSAPMQLLKSTFGIRSNLDRTGRHLSSHQLSSGIKQACVFFHSACMSFNAQTMVSECTKQLAITCQMSGMDNDPSGFWGGILIVVGNSEEKHYCHYLCDVLHFLATLWEQALCLSYWFFVPKCPVQCLVQI